MTKDSAKTLTLEPVCRNRLDKFSTALDSVIAVQTSNGNWNHCRYMHGLAKGLLLARSILTGNPPGFLSAPQEYLEARSQGNPVPVVYSTNAQEEQEPSVVMSGDTIRGQDDSTGEPPFRPQTG